MVRVNLEDSTFTEPDRFVALGRALVPVQARDLFGEDDFWSLGIGRMAKIWRYCTKHQAYSLSALMLDGFMGRMGSGELLVAADLAERDGDRFRIRGTEGRIEWYAAVRAASELGGKANAARSRKGNGSRQASRPAPRQDSRPASRSDSQMDSRTGSPLLSSSPSSSSPDPDPEGTGSQESLPIPGPSGSLASAGHSQPKQPKRRGKDTDERVSPVVRRWSDRYREHYGEDYPGSYGAAGSAVGRLPKTYTTERLVELVDAFWERPDDWVLKTAGARVEVWVNRLPALVHRETAPATDQRVTFGELDAIQRRLEEHGE